MDIILLLAIVFLLVGVVLLLAGHLVPTVPPSAISAGWGLLGLGVILLVIWAILGAVDNGDLDSRNDRDLLLGAPLVAWLKWRNRWSTRCS